MLRISVGQNHLLLFSFWRVDILVRVKICSILFCRMEQMGSEEIFHLELDTPGVRSVGTQTKPRVRWAYPLVEGIPQDQVCLVMVDQGFAPFVTGEQQRRCPGVADVCKGCRNEKAAAGDTSLMTELISKLDKFLLQAKVSQPPRNKRPLDNVQCWTCKEFGHFHNKCPNRIPSSGANPESENDN